MTSPGAPERPRPASRLGGNSGAAHRRRPRAGGGAISARPRPVSLGNSQVSLAELELFRGLAERSPDVAYRVRVRPSPSFEYVSPAIVQLLGWTPEELYAEPRLIYEMAFPEDFEQVRAFFEGRFKIDEASIQRWRRRDGSAVWTEQRVTPVVEDGVVVAVEGTARDISERMDAMERLRESEGRLRAMLEGVDILAAAFDRDARITFVNPFLCRLAGRRGDELVGLDWFESCVPEHERAVRRARWRAAVADGNATGRFDGAFLAAGGEIRDVSWSPAATFDASGGMTGVVMLGDDVTASRELHLRERRLSTAVEQTAESVVITDLQANIVYVNPAFTRITGYSSSEVVGKNSRILHSGRQSDAFYRGMWATLLGGETWTGELVNRAKDGGFYTEEATITPIRDQGGDVTGYVAVKRDVTRERALATSVASTLAERRALTRILGELEPAEAVEVSAARVVDSLLTLDDVDAAWIVTLEPEGSVAILAVAPLDRFGAFIGPVPRQGRAVKVRPEAFAGPVVAPWVRKDGDPPFVDALIEAGITATASVPIGGDSPVALLRIATTHPDGVERIAAQVPAFTELAAGIRPVIEPALRTRWEFSTRCARVRERLDAGAFEPVFQPIVQLTDLKTVGFEALTRFTDGTRPDLAFLEATSVGLGVDLEIAALAASLAAAEALPAATWLSLNISPRTVLAHDRLADSLGRRSRPTVVELTEHEPIDDYEALRASMVALGSDLRIAVDDAGAGVANFSHLVELRPDFIKVDVSLVRGINADLTRQALAVGLRHFAQAMHREVIAEGVETEPERRTLIALGIELGQGYLLGKPAPASAWSGRGGADPSIRTATA